jgi:hypothetical protein
MQMSWRRHNNSVSFADSVVLDQVGPNLFEYSSLPSYHHDNLFPTFRVSGWNQKRGHFGLSVGSRITYSGQLDMPYQENT